ERGLTGFLYSLHQKSVDWRLRMRGPRPVSPNLALLAVDERSIDTIGRWPWSRDIIAKAVDNAFKYGAKVIAFDIIFSEPQLNPAVQVYDKMKQAPGVNPMLLTSLQNYTTQMDADKVLGDVFAKYGEKIVAGSFYNSSLSAKWPPETDFC